MKPWVIATMLFLVLAPLPSCTKNDASSTEGRPLVTFVDFAEEARKEREAHLNFDHGAQLESFVTDSNGLAGWKATGTPLSGNQAWIESTNAASIPDADIIASYGIKALYHNTLTSDAHSGESIEITVTRFNTLMSAFGMYSHYRDPAYDFGTKGLGNQGFIDGNTLHVWHSRWLVRATLTGSSRPKEEINETLTAIGLEISERMGVIQKPILPRHLRVFPGTDIIANSQSYGNEPFLGIEGLPRALTSQFVNADGILTGFFMHTDSDDEATAHFQTLIDHFKNTGAMIDEYLGLGTESFRANVPGHDKGVFILHRNFIGGYLGFQEDGLPTNLLQAFVENLDSLFPDDTAHLNPPQ